MPLSTLPIYPECRKVEVADYQHFATALKDRPLEISDNIFPNVFAWRNAYHYKIAQMDGMIITAGLHEEKPFLLSPIGGPERAAEVAYKTLEIGQETSPGLSLAVAPEHLAEEMKGLTGIEITPDRDNWDYVHKSVDLAELPGPQYHAKRNLIKQFREGYKYKIEDLNTKTCAEAMEFSDRWCKQRDCESDEGLEKEKCAIYQQLSHFEALKLNGILVRIDDEIVGLTIGEELNSNTYVVHVEKGDQGFRGIYQFINQELAKRAAAKYQWINREPDMGVPGLRRAKTSYHPDHFIKKYHVYYRRQHERSCTK